MTENTDYASMFPRWYDWKWQFSHRITNVETLLEFISLTRQDNCLNSQDKTGIAKCLEHFRMAITPYYASLIRKYDKSDPVYRQAVPSIEETYFCPDDLLDPLNEEGDSPVPHLVHRYPDRVLLLVTYICSTYCRHCTRRRVVGEEDKVISDKELDTALDYIRSHPEIRDVLISGGDPLVMSTSKLEHIIAGIRTIPHVDIIRIGTRVPVVMPMRITPDLLTMLKKYHPIWINTHFNHPNEIAPESERACTAIVDAGIPLGNQSVLLKGINDTPEVMKELLLKLVHMRVRPYYLYQCDLSRGISHFRTDVDTGINIMHELTGFISGYAVPKYVIDAPHGGGKIPICYNYVREKNETEIIMENYKGDIYRYPLPQKHAM